SGKTWRIGCSPSRRREALSGLLHGVALDARCTEIAGWQTEHALLVDVDQLQPEVVAFAELSAGQPESVVPAVTGHGRALQHTGMGVGIGRAAQPYRPR